MLQKNKNKIVPSDRSGSGWLHNKLSDAAAGHAADPVSHHVCSFPFTRCRRTTHRCRTAHRCQTAHCLSLLVLGWPVVAATDRLHLPLLTLHLRSGLQALLRLRWCVCHSQCRARSIHVNTDNIDTKVSISIGPIL